MGLKYEVHYSAIKSNPRLEYTRHNKQHRLNGPAVMWSVGDQFWLQYGERHRLDGPSRLWSNVRVLEEYHIRGDRYTKEEYANVIRNSNDSVLCIPDQKN